MRPAGVAETASTAIATDTLTAVAPVTALMPTLVGGGIVAEADNIGLESLRNYIADIEGFGEPQPPRTVNGLIRHLRRLWDLEDHAREINKATDLLADDAADWRRKYGHAAEVAERAAVQASKEREKSAVLVWLLAEARGYAEFWRTDARTYGPQGHVMDIAWALPWEAEANA